MKISPFLIDELHHGWKSNPKLPKLFQKIMFLKIIGWKPEVDIVENQYCGIIYYQGIKIGEIYQESNLPFILEYKINIFNQKYTQSLSGRNMLSWLPSEIRTVIEGSIQMYFKNKFGLRAIFHEYLGRIPKL